MRATPGNPVCTNMRTRICGIPAKFDGIPEVFKFEKSRRLGYTTRPKTWETCDLRDQEDDEYGEELTTNQKFLHFLGCIDVGMNFHSAGKFFRILRHVPLLNSDDSIVQRLAVGKQCQCAE